MRNVGGAALGAARGALKTTAALGGPDVQRIGIHTTFFFALFHFLFVLLNCTLSQLDIRGGGCLTYWGFKADCDTTSYTVRSQLLTDSAIKNYLRTGAAFSIFSVLLSAATVGLSWLLCCKLRAVIRAGRRVHLERQRQRAQQQGAALTDLQAQENNADERAEPTEEEKASRSVPQFVPGQLKWTTVWVVGASVVCELIAWAVVATLYATRKTVLITTSKDLYYLDPTSNTSVYLGITSSDRNVTFGVGFGLGITAWVFEIIVLVLLTLFV
ncbi:hypothetical protein STCU_06626 [Strigomonas culicis]|uniref:Amastin-like protein n=1 Tax=Strigomonas culicis TaxID=28005 RepID=S9U4E5_9TRYP|nr:hypothetical protein STCU_06626 [Strigomonas culicis]|eukprot:EPY25617.1 hypothetical protein STCU_06626 [Strigomonas culicis]